MTSKKSLPDGAVLFAHGWVIARVGRRLVVAGLVLALAVSPAVSLAGEPDQEREGESGPGLALPDDSSQVPDFDPGGPSVELPEDPSALIDPPASDESPGLDLLEQEPAADPVPPVDTPPEPLPGPRPIAPEPAPAAPAPAPVSDPLPAPPPVTEAIRPKRDAGVEPKRDRKDTAAHRRHRNRAQPPHPSASVPAPVTTTAPTVVAVSGQQTTPAEVPVAVPTGPPPAGGKVHVVRPGECLWTIAQGLLARGATNEQIARLVARLWALNADRIGTGDPSRIMPGQRLGLP